MRCWRRRREATANHRSGCRTAPHLCRRARREKGWKKRDDGKHTSATRSHDHSSYSRQRRTGDPTKQDWPVGGRCEPEWYPNFENLAAVLAKPAASENFKNSHMRIFGMSAVSWWIPHTGPSVPTIAKPILDGVPERWRDADFAWPPICLPSTVVAFVVRPTHSRIPLWFDRRVPARPCGS